MVVLFTEAMPHQLPVVLDELGFEAYVPAYPLGVGDPAFAVTTSTEGPVAAWSLSSYDARRSCPAWTHLFSDRFLSTVEGAFRIAIMGLMPATILLYSKYDDGNGPWKSQSLMVIGLTIVFPLRYETMGMYLLYIGVFLRSSALWLPALMACSAIQLYNHIAASFVVFAAVHLLATVFMEGVCRKITMVYFTIMYMDLLRTRPLPDDKIRYVHLWAELALGTCFGMLSTVL
ncbi:transmembrane protein, putative, partial [Bodo saltans]